MINEEITEKAKKVKLVLTDIDGILTDGKLIYGANGDEQKAFHVRDGFGMKLLEKNNIRVGVLTGKNTQSAKIRVNDLKISYAEFGLDNKIPAYEDILTKCAIDDSEVAYLGDDVPDLPILERVGLSATVSDVPFYIKNKVDLCLNKKGGNGAFREFSDIILAAQGKLNF